MTPESMPAGPGPLFSRVRNRYSLIDIANLSIAGLLFFSCLLAFGDLPSPVPALAVYLFLIILVESGALLRRRLEGKRYLAFLVFGLTVVFLFTAFESLSLTLPWLNPHRYDGLMAAADRRLFGVDPTVFLEQFARPVVTEVLFILYAFYFPMPVILLVWMLRRGRLEEVSDGIFRYLVCYYGAYAAYFVIPVRGPRFHLAHLHTGDLDGVYFSGAIRDIIDLLEPNKLDAFPSLHAAILLVTLLLAFRESRAIFRWFAVLAPGIVVSLVYLRYHYVVDVLAGLLWGWASWRLGGWLSGRYAAAMAPHFGEKR